MKVFEPGARAASKSTDTVTGEMRDITWMETRSLRRFSSNVSPFFLQIKLETKSRVTEKDTKLFLMTKETLKHLHGWMFCVCVGLFYIL